LRCQRIGLAHLCQSGLSTLCVAPGGSPVLQCDGDRRGREEQRDQADDGYQLHAISFDAVSVRQVTQRTHKVASWLLPAPGGLDVPVFGTMRGTLAVVTRSTDGRAGDAARARPTKEQLAAAYGLTVEDLVAPDLDVLFCGINPSLYSAATGHHFARPGNRFWPALHAGGFTSRLLHPSEERELLDQGAGITNVVARATARADELTAEELQAGGVRLTETVERYAPRWLAVLGVTAYRSAFGRPRAAVGPQPERLGGASVWVLPNPSGLNAHWTPATLGEEFARLHAQVHAGGGG
jgi:TDG/mug DNA glycosylase family protein